MTHVRPQRAGYQGNVPAHRCSASSSRWPALGALLALLLPFRAHLSIAIPALVFVLPALVGVVIGGFLPGVVGAVGGFLVYDFFFLPPYNTLTVRSPQNWIALAVYVVGRAGRLPGRGQAAAVPARRRERRTEESERLYELSQALIGDLTLSQLLTHMVATVQIRLRARAGRRWSCPTAKRRSGRRRGAAASRPAPGNR